MSNLDARKGVILSAIVRGYVRTGEPVGSQRIADECDLGVSAATVRSDMAALEDDGYIAAPHTSAGRVPTAKGYRFYVDSLTDPRKALPEQAATEQAGAIQQLLLGADDLEDLLHRASGALSRLTRYASLVTTPRLDHSRLRHVELVWLSPQAVLAILITDSGRVEKRRLELADPVMEHDVQRARHVLGGAMSGLLLRDALDVVAGVAAGAPPEVRPVIEAVADTVHTDLAAGDSPEHVFVGGTANIAGPGYFERLEEVRRVYEALEEHVVLLQMLRDAVEVGDPAVRIGTEMPLVELAACSMVVASYDAGGEAAGTLGVLGPMRMDYPRTLASVQTVASSVEKALAELA